MVVNDHLDLEVHHDTLYEHMFVIQGLHPERGSAGAWTTMTSSLSFRRQGPIHGYRPGAGETGCGAAWLARLTGGQEVPGSNPGSPTSRCNAGSLPSNQCQDRSPAPFEPKARVNEPSTPTRRGSVSGIFAIDLCGAGAGRPQATIWWHLAPGHSSAHRCQLTSAPRPAHDLTVAAL